LKLQFKIEQAFNPKQLQQNTIVVTSYIQPLYPYSIKGW